MFRLNRRANKIVVASLAMVMTLSLSYSLASASSTNGSSINFRKGPDKTSEKYDYQLDVNTEVNIIDIEGDWIKASVNGTVGYIFSDYVNVTETNATINDGPVRMRTTPAFDNNIYEKEKLQKDQRVLVLGQEVVDGNKFYSVVFNNHKYYVFNLYVTLDDGITFEDDTKVLEEQEQKMLEEIANQVAENTNDENLEEVIITESDGMNGTVTCDVLNLRNRPSKYSTKKGKVYQNTRLALKGQSPDGCWYSFMNEENEVWVSSEYVKLDEGAFLPIIEVAKLSVADELVEFAKSYERYWRVNGNLWFDCSSYVKYVCANFNIILSGGSNDIANSNAGVIITREEAMPGDLVFIYNGAPIGHVGIYLGNGLMISNESSGVTRIDGTRGGGIMISSIDGYYWCNYGKSFMRLNNVQ